MPAGSSFGRFQQESLMGCCFSEKQTVIARRVEPLQQTMEAANHKQSTTHLHKGLCQQPTGWGP